MPLSGIESRCFEHPVLAVVTIRTALSRLFYVVLFSPKHFLHSAPVTGGYVILFSETLRHRQLLGADIMLHNLASADDVQPVNSFDMTSQR